MIHYDCKICLGWWLFLAENGLIVLFFVGYQAGSWGY